jgi:hypothetical protein
MPKTEYQPLYFVVMQILARKVIVIRIFMAFKIAQDKMRQELELPV